MRYKPFLRKAKSSCFGSAAHWQVRQCLARVNYCTIVYPNTCPECGCTHVQNDTTHMQLSAVYLLNIGACLNACCRKPPDKAHTSSSTCWRLGSLVRQPQRRNGNKRTEDITQGPCQSTSLCAFLRCKGNATFQIWATDKPPATVTNSTTSLTMTSDKTHQRQRTVPQQKTCSGGGGKN